MATDKSQNVPGYLRESNNRGGGGEEEEEVVLTYVKT